MTPLAYDPSAETSTTISGLLYKRSDHVKQWRPRYFILHLHDDMEGSRRSKNVTAATLRYYIPKSSNSNNNDYHNGYNNDEKSIDEEDGFDNNDDFKSIDKLRISANEMLAPALRVIRAETWLTVYRALNIFSSET